VTKDDQLKACIEATVVEKPEVKMLSSGDVLEVIVRTNHTFIERSTGQERNQDNYFVVKTWNDIEELKEQLQPGTQATFDGYWNGRRWDRDGKVFVFNTLSAYRISIHDGGAKKATTEADIPF